MFKRDGNETMNTPNNENTHNALRGRFIYKVFIVKVKTWTTGVRSIHHKRCEVCNNRSQI